MRIPHLSQLGRKCSFNKAIAGTVVALLFSAPSAFAATTQYLDDNAGAGFEDAPVSGTLDQNGLTWTTDVTGVAATTAFTSGDVMTFGAVAGDTSLQGTFTVNLDQATGQSLGGLVVNSTGINVTLIGTPNVHPGSQTWLVTSGSVLTMSDTRQAPGGLNFNKALITLTGGGTFNFGTAMGPNDTTATSGFNENMPGGIVNIQENNLAVGYTSTYNGIFTLTAGTLNFATAQSAGAFSGFLAANSSVVSIKGGTIDNTSGSPMTLAMGTGTYSFAGDFTFTGSSNFDLGTAAVALTANRQIIVGANTLAIDGIIGGAGFGITKAGGGTLALNNANTYNGMTTITGGTVALGAAGAINASTAIDVQHAGTFDVSALAGAYAVLLGQTLQGTGNVLGGATINGILAPGETGIGAMTFNSILSLAGITNMDIDKSVSSVLSSDLVTGVTTLTEGGTLNVNFLDTGAAHLTAGDTFTLFAAGSYAATSFSAINLPALDAGLVWDTTQLATNGSIDVIAGSAPAPEPASLGLLGIGALGLLSRRRKAV